MAIGPVCAWEVRSTGNSANGGGFAGGGIDRSQQDSPHLVIDGATITATVHTSTDQLTITGYTVSADDTGNVLNVNGGTATAGRYKIASVDVPNNRWTLDRSAGTASQTATGRMGGRIVGSLPSFVGVLLRDMADPEKRKRPTVTRGDAMATFTALLQSGQLTPIVARRFPLDQAAAAMKCLEEGRTAGRIVITP